MNSLEIIKKHITPDVPFALKNDDGSEDTIMLKPFNMAQRLLLIEVSKLLKKVNLEEDFSNKELNETLYDLYKITIMRSIPDIDEDTLENFVMSNSGELFQVIFELIPKPKVSEKINLVKERMKKIEENRKSGE